MPLAAPVTVWKDLPTPMGQICFAGELCGTGGTGFDQFRRFGLHGIVLLYDGEGSYADADGHHESLGAGDVIVVSPETAHQYGPEPGSGWHELFICFRGGALAARLAGLGCGPVLHLDDAAGWRRRFLEIMTRQPSDATAMMSAVSMLHVLLGDLAVRTRETTMPPWLARAVELLTDATTEPPDCPTIARACGLPYATFRRRFRLATGHAPAQYRRAYCLNQAAVLLRETELDIAAIAERCGFWDAAHFSQRFRREFGMPPSIWRSTKTREDVPRTVRFAHEHADKGFRA